MSKLSEYPTARSGEGPGCWLMSSESEQLCGPELKLYHLIPAPVAAATDAKLEAYGALEQAARETLGGLEKLTPDDYLTSADMFRGELLIKTLQALDALDKEAS